MARQLFTAGYEGTTIHTFITILQNNNVDCVLDVRAVPFSRKPGFSKAELSRNLESANIRYVHLPDLGTPKPIREKLKSTADYADFFETMDAHLAGKQDAIESAYRYVSEHTCCLMCFEHLAEQCHRNIVANKIKARDGNALQIKHI
ncbi:MAG: DUF488 domain-containing protein [Sedimentisphaerales bacterium]|nr:DUF488 domain-containing protein [Sedimentisphaerales bacterium]